MVTTKMHPQPSNLRASRNPRSSSTRRPVQAILASSVAALLGVSAQPVFAATQTWSGASDANWATAGNWSALPATGDSLVFTSATGLGGLTLSDALMTPGTFNVAGITFNSGAGAFVINPAASGTNGFTLTGGVTNNSTSLQTINSAITLSGTQTFTTTAGGGNLALGGVLSGGGSLTMTGSGQLILSASNSFTGGLTTGATAGSYMLLANSYAAGSGAITVAAGASGNQTYAGGLILAPGVNVPNNITLNSNPGNNEMLGMNTSGTATLSGTITLAGGANRWCLGAPNVSTSNTYIYAGPIVGGNSGQFVSLGRHASGSQTFVFSGSNSFSASYIIIYTLGQTQAGSPSSFTNTLMLGANNTLPSSVPIQFGFGQANANASAVFDLSGHSQTIGGMIYTAVSGDVANVTNSGTTSSTLTINTSSSQTYQGTITDGAQPLSLVMAGGTQILSGSNSYTGGSAINNGILEFSGTASMPATGAVTVYTGGVLGVAINGAGQFTTGTSGAGTIGGLLGGTGGQGGAVTWNSGAALGIDTTAASGTYAGLIANSGTNALGIAKLGTNTLTLTGSNTYSGATTVAAGTLNLSHPFAAQNSTVTMTGGTLVFDQSVVGNAFTVGGLSAASSGAGYNIALQNNAETPALIALTAGGNNVSTTYAAVLSGSGSLTKTGTGTLTLSGNNTYTGATTISVGTLKLQGGAFSTTPGSYSIASGAVLNLDGNTGIASGTATISGSGTLRVTGGTFQNLVGSGRSVNMNLGGGALIDVRPGATLYNGGWQAMTWTNNQASLNADGTFDITDGNPAYVDALTGTGTVTHTSYGTSGNLTVGVANGSGTFAGTITNESTRNLNLIKSGSGTQTLTGNNSYTGTTTVSNGTLILTGSNSCTGATTVSSGTLQLGNANAVPNSALTVNVNNGLAFSSGIGTFSAGALSGSGNLVLSDTASNPVTLAVGGNNATTTYSGVLSGKGSLTKNGSGTLTLSNTPAYSGSTTIAAGTLATTGTIGGLIAGPGSLTVSAGTLTLTNDSNSFGGNITNSGNQLKFTSIGNYGQNSALGTGGSNSVISFSWYGGISFTGSTAQTSNRSFYVTGLNPTLSNNGTAALNLTGSISGNTWFTLQGSYTGVNVVSGLLFDSGGSLGVGVGGTWLLNNDNNSFSGGVGSNGTLDFTSIGNYGQNSSLGTGGISTVGASFYGSLAFTGSTTQTSNRNFSFGSLGAYLYNNGSAPLNLSGTFALGNSFGFALRGSNSGNCGTISGPIVGGTSSSFIKSDAGLWTLSGSNTYVGTTNISQGTLIYGKEVSLYNNTPASWTPALIQVGNGATIGFNVGGTGEFTNSDVTTLLTNFAVATSGSGMQGGSKIAFDTTNAAGGTFTIPDTIANTTGAAGGAIGLTKYGPGTLVLAGTNSYTGATNINGGTLQFGDGSNAQSGPASAVTVNPGTTLAINLANSGTCGASILNHGTVNLVNTGTNTLSGSLAGYAYCAINQNGAGTTILTCNNAFFGNININAGAVQLAYQYAGTDSTFNVGVPNGLTFGLTTGTIGGLAGTSGFTLLTTAGSGVNLSVGANNYDSTYSGAISGTSSASALTKVGTGTLTLAGSNSYVGPTAITGGTLQLGNANALQNSTLTVNLANSLTFSSGIGPFNAGALSGSASLVLSDTASNPVTLSVGGNNATTTYTGVLSGNGSLTKSGTGTLNLTNTPAYSGSTTLADGTLATTGTFGGLIGGPGSLSVTSGTLTLTNNSNSFGGNLTTVGNTLKFTSIGNYGQNSSLGTGGSNSVITISNYGTMAFTGSTTQTSNRSFSITGANSVLNNNGTAALNLTGSISGNNGFSLGGSYTGVNTVSGLLSDSGGSLGVVGGGGTWLLNNDNNSFSGGVGSTSLLEFTSVGNYGQNSSLGTGGTNSTISASFYGSLAFTGSTAQTSNRNFSFNGIVGRLRNDGSAPLNLSGTVTIGTSDEFWLLGSNSGNCGTISGPLVGGGTSSYFIKPDSGFWTFSGTNTYGGHTGIGGGTLIYGKEGSLYNNTPASWTPSKIQVGNGATIGFNVGGDGEFTNSDVTTLLTNFAVATSGNGMQAGSKLAFDTTNALGGTFTIPDTIANTTGTTGGAISLTKYGTGTLVLTGSNTYTGATTINGGTLQIGDGTTDGSIASTSGIANNGSLVYNLVGSQSFTHVISGSGTLTKSGPGTLTLTGANTYSGGATINSGTLAISGVGKLSGTTGSLAANSGVLDLGATSQTVGAVSIAGGTIQNGALSGASFTSTGGTVSASLGGTGALTHSTGLLTLSGSNTYSGGTTMSSGTLQLGNAHALGATTGGLTVNGGTLDLNGNSVSVGALSGVGGSITSSASGTSALTTTIASGTSTYAGNIADGAGSVALTKEGAGKLILGGSLSIARMNAEEGATQIQQSGSIGVLSVAAGATVSITANSDGTRKVLDLSSLTIFGFTSGLATTNSATSATAAPALLNADNVTAFSNTSTLAAAGQTASGIVPAAEQVSPEAVPEPGVFGMLLTGAMGLLGTRRNGRGKGTNRA